MIWAIAFGEAKLPVLKLVLDMYKELMAEGYSELGTQGLIKCYDKDSTFIREELKEFSSVLSILC